MRCLRCHQDGVPSTVTVCPRCGVHLPTVMRDVLPPRTLLQGGKYQIDYALGQGGFGITYRAAHTALEQLVAIKEFYPSEHAHRDGATLAVSVSSTERDVYDRGLARFQREGQVLSRLRHPNVVGVHDLFAERGTAYLVMDLVRGHTLRDAIDATPGRRLPLAQVDLIMNQLVAALATVHEQRVFHLDVKPDNVLVDEAGRVVLVDFGAARQGVGSGKTTQAFTVEYAPPEVVAGGEVGPDSDIFELGMMLHEMLTGERPPSALSRLVRDDWQPNGLGEPWRSRVRAAVRLQRAERPVSVPAWWSGATPSRPPAPAPDPRPAPMPVPPRPAPMPAPMPPRPAPSPRPVPTPPRPAPVVPRPAPTPRGSSMSGGVKALLVLPFLLGIILILVGLFGDSTDYDAGDRLVLLALGGGVSFVCVKAWGGRRSSGPKP